MIKEENVWECACGYLDYSKESPDACPQCRQLESFIQLPPELAEERERALKGDMDSELEEDKNKYIPKEIEKLGRKKNKPKRIKK